MPDVPAAADVAVIVDAAVAVEVVAAATAAAEVAAAAATTPFTAVALPSIPFSTLPFKCESRMISWTSERGCLGGRGWTCFASYLMRGMLVHFLHALATIPTAPTGLQPCLPYQGTTGSPLPLPFGLVRTPSSVFAW